MFTAYGDSEKIFKKDSRITFDKFLVNTDDSFDLEEGIFKANKGTVHKWRHLHFEIFDPPLPPCHLRSLFDDPSPLEWHHFLMTHPP